MEKKAHELDRIVHHAHVFTKEVRSYRTTV